MIFEYNEAKFDEKMDYLVTDEYFESNFNEILLKKQRLRNVGLNFY